MLAPSQDPLHQLAVQFPPLTYKCGCIWNFQAAKWVKRCSNPSCPPRKFMTMALTVEEE